MPRRDAVDVQEEYKYDEPQRRDKDDAKQQAQQQKQQSKSREVELREAYQHADFSERSGLSPAERMAQMSVAATRVQEERVKEQKAQEQEAEKAFWDKEHQVHEEAPVQEPGARPASTQEAAPEQKAPQQIKGQVRGMKAFQRSDAGDRDEDEAHEQGAEWPSERRNKMMDAPPATTKEGRMGRGFTQKKDLPKESEGPKDKLADQPAERDEDEGVEEEDPIRAEQRERQEIQLRAQKETQSKLKSRAKNLGDTNIADTLLKQEPASLDATLRQRKAELDRLGLRDAEDEANKPGGHRRTLMDQVRDIGADVRNLSLLGTKKNHETHEPVAVAHTREPSQLDKRANAFVTHSIRTNGDIPTSMRVPTQLHVKSDPSGVQVRREDGSKLQQDEGMLSAAKHQVEHGWEKVEQGWDKVEDKLEHWKDEASEKLSDLKDDASGKLSDIKHKIRGEAEEVREKGRETLEDARIKGAEIKSDIREEVEELHDDAADLMARARSQAHEKTSALSNKAREWQREAKAEMRDAKADVHEDVSGIKGKMHDMGEGIKRRTEKIVAKVKGDDTKSASRSSSPAGEIDEELSSKFTWGAPIASAKTEPVGFMQRIRSWWSPSSPSSSSPRDESAIVPPKRVSQWDLDNARTYGIGGVGINMAPKRDAGSAMSTTMARSSADPVSVVEGTGGIARSWKAPGAQHTHAGDIKSQLGERWQHIKADFKESDHVDSADSASSSDFDSAPNSPRSSLLTGTPHLNTFSPSLSDVMPSDSPNSYREHKYTARKVELGMPTTRGGGSGAFISKLNYYDPVMVDAAVEPW